MAQQSVPRRPLSPNVVIDPPPNVTEDRDDKRFSNYPKTNPLFKQGEVLFPTQLTEPSVLKKPEIRKLIRVTYPLAPLTKTTFQQQRTSAVQERNRSPVNISQNRSSESRKRRKLNQTNPRVIYQPLARRGASGLPKIKVTEFSGDPLEWPEWSGLFDVVVNQRSIIDTEKMLNMKTSLTSQAEDQYREGDSAHNHTIMLGIYSVRSIEQIRCHIQRAIQETAYSSFILGRRFYAHRQFCKFSYKWGGHLESTCIHIRPRSRSRAKFNSFSPQLREEWLQHIQDRRLPRSNLVFFQRVPSSRAVIHEDLLAQTNS